MEGKEQASYLRHTQPDLLAILRRMTAPDARARISAQDALDALRILWTVDRGRPAMASGFAGSGDPSRPLVLDLAHDPHVLILGHFLFFGIRISRDAGARLQ